MDNEAETIQERMTFELWWESPLNPCAGMLETTKDQIKSFMRQAWFAGRRASIQGVRRRREKREPVAPMVKEKHERFTL